jgi:GTP-binding protein
MLSDNFRITLVGRTNVGKSTLFNRISGTRTALVFDSPGVTRDIRELAVKIFDKEAKLIDTPGMFDSIEKFTKLSDIINSKIDDVVKSSDLVILVLDGLIGISTNDKEIVNILRKRDKNTIVVINKSENKYSDTTYFEAMEFGFKQVIKISAEHGLGIDKLLDSIHGYLPDKILETGSIDCKNEKIKLSIIGKPNVGKSTIVNRILGQEKRLVADFAGLTRESAEFTFEFNGKQIQIIDTPGLRRKSRICENLERISSEFSKKAYNNCDIVVLVIDASTLEKEGQIDRYDIILAAEVIKRNKPLVIAFNKCDEMQLDKNEATLLLQHNFARSLSQLKAVPFLFISAINDYNITKMLQVVESIYSKQSKKIKTSKLNCWLSQLNKSAPLQNCSAKFKLKYMTQVGNYPLTFLIFTTKMETMRSDQKRYIINNLRQSFGLEDLVINVKFKNSDTSGV